MAAERGFYELEQQGTKASLEPAMSDIEAKTAGAFGNLLEARRLDLLSPEEEAFIAVFLALQRHRVRNFREALKDMDVAMAEKIRRGLEVTRPTSKATPPFQTTKISKNSPPPCCQG